MPNITIGLSIILIVLGLAGYYGTGQESGTALIPTAFGILMLGMGILAKKERMRSIAMHIAAGLAVLGFGGTVGGLMKLIAVAGGAEVARPVAVIVQSIMALLCLGYVILAVKSFVDARKARSAK